MNTNRCDECVTDKSLCDKCMDNPKYADYPKTSKFQAYIPVCHAGYSDCIHDPAYIKYHYPEWYKSMWGNKSPEKVVKECCDSEEYIEGEMYCYHYDDEDK